MSGDLGPHGFQPGDPYELLNVLADRLEFKRPPARVLANIARSIGFEHLKPIAPPPRRRCPDGVASLKACVTARARDADAIHAPLRRVQPVLRVGARALDDLHLARSTRMPDTTLEEAQENEVPAWCSRSSRLSRATGCLMSAAAGAGWSATPPST